AWVAAFVLPTLQAAALGLPVVGPASAALVGLVPWVAGIWIAAAPILFVRGVRRRRVEELESDLPLVLELLATLAEAGHGFDGSVAQVIESQPEDRALCQELRLYQLEVMTGVGRAECLRRLGVRTGVPSIEGVVSALVQAEELGSGLADLLRPQADDLRHRRREQALAQAESLPEKLVVPLLVGFLPGLLVWTLGPAFNQLFTMIDAAMTR
ncbi:MAG: type II secretion system F family protein, partial [Myxococcota bacterium]|nr:type II secretion system F family protein [Myxococcota bacterium]